MKKLSQALQIAFEFTGQRMSDEVIVEMARELSHFHEGDVLLALKRCRSELRIIKYADILDRLPGQHPGVEQAWGIVSKIMDNEHLSICWTREMREAYGAAAPLADDKVAARMAFKEVYTNLVSEARATRQRPIWDISLGWDKVLREECCREAVATGKISQQIAEACLGYKLNESLLWIDQQDKKRIGGWVAAEDVMKEVLHGLPTVSKAD